MGTRGHPGRARTTARESRRCGRGTVRGALIGAFVMVGVSTLWQTVIKGAVIIVAVMLDQGEQRLKRSRSAAAAAAGPAPSTTARELRAR